MMQSTVLSHQYINKIESLMRQITSNASKDISKIIELDRTASHIRSFSYQNFHGTQMNTRKLENL